MEPRELSLGIPTWRPGQWELVTRIVSSEAPIVMLEAPPGIGKSVVAVACGRLLGEKAIVLTSTKQLQDQYAHEFYPKMLTAKGRGNFVCNQDPTVTADRAVCTVGEACEYANTPECDYHAQKINALNAPEAVLNYAYWLNQANYPHKFREPEVLICDEAHLVEDELRRFASIKLRFSALKKFGIWPGPMKDVQDWVEWAPKALAKLSKYLVIGNDDDKRSYDALKQALRDIVRLGGDDNWVVIEDKYGETFQPVWINALAQRYLFRHAKKIIFMSATILDAEMFATNLGLDPANVEFIRADSTFDPKRRPLYYAPVGKVKASDTASLDRLVEGIDEILDKHAGQSGLIHTSSYKIAQHVMAHSRYVSRLVTHDSASRTSQIERFRRTPGAVLVSPSVTTGVDLPYELCSFQIIAKLSFPDLGDPQIKKRMKVGPDGKPTKRGQGWYNWNTACSLIQAYGRGMRAHDDYCDTYLLDGNFKWFRATVRDMLPLWFTGAIQYPRAAGTAPGLSPAEQIAKIRAEIAS